MDKAAPHTLRLSVCLPSEGPKSIWRKNPLGSFLVTVGPESSGGAQGRGDSGLDLS